MKATENEAFFSHILTINVGGSKATAIIKDLQRHPAKPRIMHADFQRILQDQAITVDVPLHFVNEESCVGVKTGGGLISHNMTQIRVSCLPSDLPEYIEVDVVNVNVGETVHMSELSLPAGLPFLSWRRVKTTIRLCSRSMRTNAPRLKLSKQPAVASLNQRPKRTNNPIAIACLGSAL